MKNLLLRVRTFLKFQSLVIPLFVFLPDVISMTLTAITAYNFRFTPGVRGIGVKPSIAQFEYKGILIWIVISWILILITLGTYKLSHVTLFVFNLSPLIKRTIIFYFFLGFLSFILKASFSRTLFLILLAAGLFYLSIIRFLVFFLILRPFVLRKILSSRIILIGRNNFELSQYTDWLVDNRSLGFVVASRLVCQEISSDWINEFDFVLESKDITEVLLLPGMESDEYFSKFIHYCEDLGIHVNWVPLDSGNLGYWLIPRSQHGIPFLTFEKSEISIMARFSKRIFDLLFATVFLIVLSPIYLVISVAILVTSGWPIIYSQNRIGLKGRTFRFYKFRSMKVDSDKMLNQVTNMHGVNHVLFKNRQDPRITKIGRHLRKYSLDELPQFFNVLIGSMSVVGPRPALPNEVNSYSSVYERRLKAKPGITGPWQISGRSDLDLKTSVALDLNYLINWSFTKDLSIIISTIGAIAKGKGAY